MRILETKSGDARKLQAEKSCKDLQDIVDRNDIDLDYCDDLLKVLTDEFQTTGNRKRHEIAIVPQKLGYTSVPIFVEEYFGYIDRGQYGKINERIRKFLDRLKVHKGDVYFEYYIELSFDSSYEFNKAEKLVGPKPVKTKGEKFFHNKIDYWRSTVNNNIIDRMIETLSDIKNKSLCDDFEWDVKSPDFVHLTFKFLIDKSTIVSRSEEYHKYLPKDLIKRFDEFAINKNITVANRTEIVNMFKDYLKTT